ncbi:Putative protein of unknown function [Podospora comata]|uniref:Uncharacterized protein n=1 Tax=Podospora comata TaxID=48703 RepID=A0ABY6RVT8_PODCO|nr:Putative protein of unknown function [Podospora comata]
MKFSLLTVLATGTAFHQALASPVMSDSAPAKRQDLVTPFVIECSPGTVPGGGDPNVFCSRNGISCTLDGELEWTPTTTDQAPEQVCFDICYCRVNVILDPPAGGI